VPIGRCKLEVLIKIEKKINRNYIYSHKTIK
jgi:hypothetical protein